RVTSILGRTAQLQLFDLETSVTGPSATDTSGNVQPSATLYDLLAGQQARANAGQARELYLFDAKQRVRAGPVEIDWKRGGRDAAEKSLLSSEDKITRNQLKGELPKGWKIFAVPENTTVITCGTDAVVCPGPNGGIQPTQTYYYLFKYDPSN